MLVGLRGHGVGGFGGTAHPQLAALGKRGRLEVAAEDRSS